MPAPPVSLHSLPLAFDGSFTIYNPRLGCIQLVSVLLRTRFHNIVTSPVESLQSNDMGLLTLKRAVSDRLIAYHEHIPGLRKLPYPAVKIISVLVFANAIVWVAVGILLVWLLRRFALTLFADAFVALSCVRDPGRVQRRNVPSLISIGPSSPRLC